ncbi:unnamed protein product [Clonostachys rosea]|uniref:Uncharacterized protein n=1 Tax=Bionectria ochroleuca TaxID=29856 RepID=A0ABY6US45_BIOOC|nr:unnamed protein product [Clonostachys rosea]
MKSLQALGLVKLIRTTPKSPLSFMNTQIMKVSFHSTRDTHPRGPCTEGQEKVSFDELENGSAKPNEKLPTPNNKHPDQSRSHEEEHSKKPPTHGTSKKH